jgi:hypothetical protein
MERESLVIIVAGDAQARRSLTARVKGLDEEIIYPPSPGAATRAVRNC